MTGATTGAVSDGYTRAKAKTTADTTQNSRKLAYLTARSGTGASLARDGATAGSDYSSDMLGYGTDSKMTKNRLNVGLSNASNSGNGLALLGGLLSASAGAIGGLGGAAKAPVPLRSGCKEHASHCARAHHVRCRCSPGHRAPDVVGRGGCRSACACSLACHTPTRAQINVCPSRSMG